MKYLIRNKWLQFLHTTFLLSIIFLGVSHFGYFANKYSKAFLASTFEVSITPDIDRFHEVMIPTA